MVVEAKGALRGEITVPGDKSISHRAAILGALAEGETVITGFLPGADCLATVRCLQQLGVEIAVDGGELQVKGAGLYGLKEPDNVLDCGNSGTTARLLLGVLAGQPFFSLLTGDASLRRRPMGRVTKPLQEMGARFFGRQGGNLLPLAVQGGSLSAVKYKTPVASAQLKSAILLAGLFAEGETVVTEPEQSRDHTERMLAAFGAELGVGGTTVRLVGRPRLMGRAITVPGDISSAAFFLVAAAIVPGSEVLVRNVGVNPTRTGILDVLRRMGARVDVLHSRSFGEEPVADLLVRPGKLRGVEIGGPLIPRLIDELPVLAVAALFAAGRTVVRDARELRVKETDRIAAVAEELAKIGGVVATTEDGFIIEGGQRLAGGCADSRHDHRMAMALAVAGLRANAPVCIDNAECVNVSFPDFAATLARLQE